MSTELWNGSLLFPAKCVTWGFRPMTNPLKIHPGVFFYFQECNRLSSRVWLRWCRGWQAASAVMRVAIPLKSNHDQRKYTMARYTPRCRRPGWLRRVWWLEECPGRCQSSSSRSRTPDSGHNPSAFPGTAGWSGQPEETRHEGEASTPAVYRQQHHKCLRNSISFHCVRKKQPLTGTIIVGKKITE